MLSFVTRPRAVRHDCVVILEPKSERNRKQKEVSQFDYLVPLEKTCKKIHILFHKKQQIVQSENLQIVQEDILLMRDTVFFSGFSLQSH